MDLPVDANLIMRRLAGFEKVLMHPLQIQGAPNMLLLSVS